MLEDELFSNRVFEALDADGSGIIEWDEFIDAMTKLEKGERSERAGFLFDVYDKDKGGSIDTEEIAEFFKASLRVSDKPDEDGVVQEVSFLLRVLTVRPYRYPPHISSCINGRVCMVTLIAMQLTDYFVGRVFDTLSTDNEGITMKSLMDYVDKQQQIEDIYSIFGRSMTSSDRLGRVLVEAATAAQADAIAAKRRKQSKQLERVRNTLMSPFQTKRLKEFRKAARKLPFNSSADTETASQSIDFDDATQAAIARCHEILATAFGVTTSLAGTPGELWLQPGSSPLLRPCSPGSHKEEHT